MGDNEKTLGLTGFFAQATIFTARAAIRACPAPLDAAEPARVPTLGLPRPQTSPDPDDTPAPPDSPAGARHARKADSVQTIETVAIAAAAVAAGGVNAVVGSGTLITFPTLLAFGYPPVLANVSNTIGLVPGSLGAAYGYRGELRGQRGRLIRLGLAALCGGLVGALLLLALPADVFRAAVPVLILLACVLVLLQPRVGRWFRRRGERRDVSGSAPLWAGVFGTGVYGGYFGAAQGVLLIALLGTFLRDDLQRLNALKNVLAAIVNGVAAVVFVAVAEVDWAVAGVIALGATVGGILGARLGRRLPPAVLRGLVVVVGVIAAAAVAL